MIHPGDLVWMTAGSLLYEQPEVFGNPKMHEIDFLVGQSELTFVIARDDTWAYVIYCSKNPLMGWTKLINIETFFECSF